MPLIFIDEGGNEGRIADDLTLEYAGPVDVEGYIDRVAEGISDDATAFDEVAIRLAHELPLKSVEREEGNTPATGRS